MLLFESGEIKIKEDLNKILITIVADIIPTEKGKNCQINIWQI